MTKRAALYLRQSKTDDIGIERQIERTNALATARGWQVVATYVDNDVSASKPRGAKTAWGQMLAHADDFDVVIGVDLDRVVRTTRDINILIDRGLMLVTVDGEIDLTTADGEFRASMLAAIARFEVRRKGERQRRANEKRAERGGVPKGVRLTGYNVDGTVLDYEAEIVMRIFEEFTRGKALTHIAKKLNDDAIDTRSGRPWHPSSVRTILLNARYAGRRVYRGEVVAGPAEATWTPLVSEPIFDKAQGILSDEGRIKNREGTARKHIGSGLYLCGPCRVRVTSNGKRYSCPKCGRIRTMAPIDKRVFDAITDRLSKPDLASVLVAPKDDAEDVRLQGVIKDARAQLSNVERDYDDGLIDGRRFQAAREKAMARLTDALEARAALAGSDALAKITNAPDPAQAFLDADFEVKRTIIDASMFVLIQPVAQGTRGFDPSTVVPAWRLTQIGDDIVPVVPQLALEALR